MMIKETETKTDSKEDFIIHTDMYKNDIMYFFYCYSHCIIHINSFLELIYNNYPKDQKKLIRIYGTKTKQYLHKLDIVIENFDMGKYAKKCNIYKYDDIENIYLCNAFFIMSMNYSQFLKIL